MTPIPHLTRNMFSPEAQFYVFENFFPVIWDEGQRWLIGPQGKCLAAVQARPMTMDVGTFELTWDQFRGQVEDYWREMYE